MKIIYLLLMQIVLFEDAMDILAPGALMIHTFKNFDKDDVARKWKTVFL